MAGDEYGKDMISVQATERRVRRVPAPSNRPELETLGKTRRNTTAD
jgi:hypothetical protein